MSVNIEDIMADIRSEIQKNGYQKEMLSFSDVPYAEQTADSADRFDSDVLRDHVQFAEEQYCIEPEKELQGNFLVTAARKLARKMTRFYVEPIAEEQSAVNASLVQAMQEVELFIQESQEQNQQALHDRIEMLEFQQKNNRLQIEQLREQVQALQAALHAKEPEAQEELL